MRDNGKINFEWSISDENYVIRNVPCYTVKDQDELFSLDVTLKMAALKDLMFDRKIPKDIDYEDYRGIKY